MPRSWGKDIGGVPQEKGRMAEASEEGLGSKWAVVPMIVVVVVATNHSTPCSLSY